MIKMTFHKYPKIVRLGSEDCELQLHPKDKIIVEEKVDGANFRFMIKDENIIFGSRNTELGTDEDDIGGNWKRCVEFIKSKFGNKKFSPADLMPYNRYIFFGECCTKHTMAYDWEKIPPYLGFDIMDMSTGKFLPYRNKVLIFKEFDIPIVPLIKKIKAEGVRDISDDGVPESAYPSPSATTPEEKQAEGLVFKNYDKQIFGKYVREKFKEKNMKTFGRNKKNAENDNEMITAVYGTNARIEKIVFKLIDEGNKLDMPLMHLLPNRVLEDIYEEHWKEICMSKWSLNFRTIRKSISGRCLEVLKNIIANNEIRGTKK